VPVEFGAQAQEHPAEADRAAVRQHEFVRRGARRRCASAATWHLVAGASRHLVIVAGIICVAGIRLHSLQS
jgi:hypothetical protein